MTDTRKLTFSEMLSPEVPGHFPEDEAFAYPTEEEQDFLEARAAERLTLEREAAANFAFYAGESDDVTF